MAKRIIKIKIDEEYGNAMKTLIVEGKYKSQTEIINKALGGHLKRYYSDRIKGHCPYRLKNIENSRKGESKC